MTARDASAAVAAAQAVATIHGVSCGDATVLPRGTNALVHLKPSPLVARVMTGTATLHEDLRAWLEREVAVGIFIAANGGPIVPPSDLLPPGPYHHNGFWMTVWTFVEHELSDRSPDAREVGRSLRALHAILAGFDRELDPFAGIGDDLGRLIASLRPCSWLTGRDIELLESELLRLTPRVFAGGSAGQAIHGDASLSNLLHAGGRVLWNDFEDVCTGPIAWDVSGLVTSARARGESDGYTARFLEAYGGLDVAELTDFIDAHALYGAVWQAFDAQRARPSRTTAPARIARWLDENR